MTKRMTGKQVLALLAQNEVPEIEESDDGVEWIVFFASAWTVKDLMTTSCVFRIRPKPARRMSVTLANGEVVSWPEPQWDTPTNRQDYWVVDFDFAVVNRPWDGDELDNAALAFGNVHLDREAAQEHADALRKINTQRGK